MRCLFGHRWVFKWSLKCKINDWPYTLVGQRCRRCGKTRTQELKGHWTEGDLR